MEKFGDQYKVLDVGKRCTYISYRYDGSNAGLLCALADAIKSGAVASFHSEDSSKFDFALESHIVHSDEERSEIFLKWLQGVSSAYSVQILIYILMSDYRGYEDTLLKYCQLLRKHGNNATRMQSDPTIRSIMDRCYKVTKEIHRFKGLIRFQELESGRYWAPFEPDNNIVVALFPHFKARFENLDWILHDVSRQILITWEGKVFCNEEANKYMQQENISDSEEEIQQLWQTFFKSIVITNRFNSKAQAQFMPKRYWKYLPELKGSD